MSERLRKSLITKREVRAIALKLIIEEVGKPDRERVERLTNLLWEHRDDIEEQVRLEARRLAAIQSEKVHEKSK